MMRAEENRIKEAYKGNLEAECRKDIGKMKGGEGNS